MSKAQKGESKSLEEPKRWLERLLELSAFFIGYFYIYVYQNMLHIEVELVESKTLVSMPIIAVVVIPLIRHYIIKPDPLQRSSSQRKSIRFFQNEFPSKHLLERCERCIENEKSCQNYITPESYTHIRIWFNDIFHGQIEKQNPRSVRDTFDKGYTCKLLYYMSWILGIFLALGIATIAFHHVYMYFADKIRIELTGLQILFPLACVGIIILTKALNNPDENTPSGCWHAWREINRMHVSWLDSHEDFLVNLICHNLGGTKRFREK